ncbi:N-formylglutamate amidohydrolase [Paracoccus alkanivorans]|uniref:N-formylglutamate amidohydrolase n=1 Tax=Paracoccus alkanivorans TaxID=2116655 RepID=A0A3M0MHR3_9RHOB|nr:N-formylglutamate amidohydrolase [Paracoccus alkanivorans]RMC37266.1 N-formylglutamate amidohydrolase [Paracoccus alkanivorans]
MPEHAAHYAIEGGNAPGPAVLVCEHASNDFPPPWDGLGLSEGQRQAHIAWDPGALGLARELARRLGAPLIHGTASRLILDLNRPPHSPAAMPEHSEAHDIPGNQHLSTEERLRRTEAIYIPFHAALSALLARRLAAGQCPVLVTVHSFTRIYFGQAREVEFGILHDADDRLARAILARDTGLTTRLNEPYSAADGVTHTLARHATPMGLASVMLEIRNDLLAGSQAGMAERLAPVLRAAIQEVA